MKAEYIYFDADNMGRHVELTGNYRLGPEFGFKRDRITARIELRWPSGWCDYYPTSAVDTWDEEAAQFLDMVHAAELLANTQ